MPVSKFSPLLGLLMISLVVIGTALLISMSANPPNRDAVRMADPQATGTTVSQATAVATQPVPTTTSVAMSPTVPPQGTAEPTIMVIVHPSTVVTGTHTSEWLGPTPNPTQQAEANLHGYLNERLYMGPATLVAQGTNATPVPSEVFTGLSLTTYEVQRIDLPQQVTWDTWVPRASGGLELRPITFDRAWRVTIKGSAFYVGNNAWTMVADGTLLGPGIETGMGLTTIVYDRSLLREGSHLGISYAGGLQYLSEALHLPPDP
jgi:hypothetical protein